MSHWAKMHVLCLKCINNPIGDFLSCKTCCYWDETLHAYFWPTNYFNSLGRIPEAGLKLDQV